jgi:heterodisulfide reductase subunit C
MEYIDNILFLLLLAAGAYWFARNISKVRRNILLGRDVDRTDNSALRWKTMMRVALGQSKMVTRPVAATLHIFVYVGFVIINIEVLEIIIDGIFGTHRVLSFLGPLYTFLIATFEILALLVFVGCAIFLIRRNIIKLKRFVSKDLDGWPRSDANYILFTELLLMSAFLLMNAADLKLQHSGFSHYTELSANAFPVSHFLTGVFGDASPDVLVMTERFMWWFHIIGILAFLNYLPYSKHLHILFAFPNTYYSNLNAKGGFTNAENVQNEVKAIMDPSFTPPAPAEGQIQRFGAKDVTDLTWKQLLDSYTCTECGRCTSACPANITGKLLSPRKIMMATRDRLEDVGKNMDANNGTFVDDGKPLLGTYITPEELWSCTSCNACVQECPVNIDPLSIIIDLRRYMVMEESAAPTELNMMLTNLENNGAPWQFSPSDRLNWANED